MSETVYISQDCLPSSWYGMDVFRNKYYNAADRHLVKFLGTHTVSNHDNPDPWVQGIMDELLGTPYVYYEKQYCLILPSKIYMPNYMSQEANRYSERGIPDGFGIYSTDDLRALLFEVEAGYEGEKPLIVVHNTSSAWNQHIPGLFVLVLNNCAGYWDKRSIGEHEVCSLQYGDTVFQYGFDRYIHYENGLMDLIYSCAVNHQQTGARAFYKNYNSGMKFNALLLSGDLTYETATEDSYFNGMELSTQIMKPEFWNNFILPMVVSPELLRSITNGPLPDDLMLRKLVVRCRKDLLDRQKNLKTHMDALRADIEQYIKHVTNFKINLDNDTLDLSNVEKQLTNVSADSILQQFHATEALDYVDKVAFVGDTITVRTHEINIDGIVPIGPFDLVLYPWATQIKIYNKNNPKNGFDHPHVRGGSPCWGNYTDIYYHLSKFELVTVVELLYNYLSSWNYEDTWGHNLVWWDAEYFFDFMEEVDYLRSIPTDHDARFFEIRGEHLPQWLDIYCPNCNRYRQECTCEPQVEEDDENYEELDEELDPEFDEESPEEEVEDAEEEVEEGEQEETPQETGNDMAGDFGEGDIAEILDAINVNGVIEE